MRPALAEDAEAVAELIHVSAAAMLERFAGDRDSSLRVLRAAFRRSGNSASGEVAWVAERDGTVAAAMAAFPAGELERRARRFLRVLLLRTPPWTWRQTLRLHRLGLEVAPPPPAGTLYVDSLATYERHRRAGAARALLAEAEHLAAERGMTGVSLETSAGNAEARALYESAGFYVSAKRLPRSGLPGLVAYVKPVRRAP
ncbi:MAG: Acetyltransferase family [Thermoleophilaceae bacterium]|nr:Acetyltransferase family [Thermoleophilaceae bacterium]